jgi:hypothetical protein
MRKLVVSEFLSLDEVMHRALQRDAEGQRGADLSPGALSAGSQPDGSRVMYGSRPIPGRKRPVRAA